MQEMFPLELKQKFKAKIIKIELYLKQKHRTFFQCSTNYGQMTLLIEQLETDSQQIKGTTLAPYQYFKSRNGFLSHQRVLKYVPVIYQQYLLQSHKDKSTCFTLMEPIQLINFHQNLINQSNLQKETQYKNSSHEINNISQTNLIFFADQLSKFLQFQLQLTTQIYQLKNIMRSKINSKLYFDFSCLKKVQPLKDLQSAKSIRQNLITNNLNVYLSVFDNKVIGNNDKIDEVIFLKDKIFKFSYKKLQQLPLKNWTSLAIYLNLFLDVSVQFRISNQVKDKDKENIQSSQQQNKKYKLSQLKKLNGKNIQLCLQDNIFKHLSFLDGICTNSLQEITYQDLVKSFFIKSSISPASYTIAKQTYVMVFACKSNQLSERQDELISTNQDLSTDILIVRPEVNKLECINFFITYFKYIDPILKRISFFKQENLLQFQFLNKQKKKRKVKIKFYQEYTIKDQQISMIIQKSKLEDAILSLSKMSITDSFLLFLANSDKMKKIKHLDISYCQKITQNGVNSLLISPFCKKLQVLNVSGAQIMDSSIQSLALKANLSQLYINDCKRLDQNISSKIAFKNQALHRLQAVGVNVQICIVDSLQYLKLTNQFSLQSLKMLKNLFLKQLTIKLIDNKKNIMDLFGNFYGKQVNPIKAFIQGNSANTLKYLDISNSTVKIKNIRSMFHMPELQTLKLNNIYKLNQIDFPISAKIISLSVESCPLKIKDLNVILKNTKIMSRLSICHTQIGKFQIIDFIVQNKKFINTLCLNEQQYTNKLIQKDKPILQFVQSIQVRVDRLIVPQMEYMLNQMLYKISKSNKVVRLVIDSKDENILIGKIKKYLLTVNGLPLKNFYINLKGYNKIINTRIPEQNQSQQHIIIHKPFIKPIKALLTSSDQNQSFRIKQNTGDKQKVGDRKISSMTNFTYLYKKIVSQHPNDIYEVSVRGNKTVSSSLIKMLIEYSTEQKIKSLDFRNCVFSFMDIVDFLIDIPFLNSVNNGEYELVLQSQTFLQLSQKYLKFFMRIKQIKKLKIIANQIVEADIFFSIVYHVIDQHCQSLRSLEIELNGIKIIEESVNFWVRIFTLKNLKKLVLNLNNCQNYEILKDNLSNLHQINLPKLKQLKFLNFPIEYLPLIKCGSLQEFQANLQKSSITQQSLVNIIKPFSFHLKTLKINCSCCEMMIHLSKLVPFLKAASNLQKLVLSFQYCALKESSLFQFIQNVSGLTKLKYFQLDLSYTINLLNELVRNISNAHQNISKCYFKIYAINQNSKDFVFHKEELDSQGIQIIT